MSSRRLETWLLLLLGLCALATLAMAIYMAQPWGDNYAYQDASGYRTLGVMLLWALSPVAALALGARLLRRSRVALQVWAGGALLIGLAAMVPYVDATFVRPDPQGGLVFVFAPLVQWVAVLALGVACTVLRLWKPDKPGGGPG
jgi:hypothetical protein